MKSFAGKKMIIVADGAAFGANMAEVYRYTMLHKDKILLCLPESTEWKYKKDTKNYTESR